MKITADMVLHLLNREEILFGFRERNMYDPDIHDQMTDHSLAEIAADQINKEHEDRVNQQRMALEVLDGLMTLAQREQVGQTIH